MWNKNDYSTKKMMAMMRHDACMTQREVWAFGVLSDSFVPISGL
jgi:hypothetical protein